MKTTPQLPQIRMVRIAMFTVLASADSQTYYTRRSCVVVPSIPVIQPCQYVVRVQPGAVRFFGALLLTYRFDRSPCARPIELSNYPYRAIST